MLLMDRKSFRFRVLEAMQVSVYEHVQQVRMEV